MIIYEMEQESLRDIKNARALLRSDEIGHAETVLSEIDWTVQSYFSPCGSGFWWFRPYRALEVSIRALWDGWCERNRNLDIARIVSSVARRNKWKKKSESTFFLLGHLSRSFGSLFMPTNLDIRIPGRVFSVLTPSCSAAAVREHFEIQVSTFRKNCASAADESSLLFVTSGDEASYWHTLLTCSPYALSENTLHWIESEVSRLLNDDELIARALSEYPPSLKNSSSVLICDPRRLGVHEFALRLAAVRCKFVSGLNFPPLIDSARGQLYEWRDADGFAELYDEINLSRQFDPVLCFEIS